jgi:hypothetical protein
MNDKGEKVVIKIENESEGRRNLPLNRYQIEHINSERNVYAPIESYYEEWVHITDDRGRFVSAHPKEGTRRRSDMPSLAEQWRADWARRSSKREKPHGKGTSHR